MAKPVLRIELDPGPWDQSEFVDHRGAGGTVSGHVHLATDETVTCRRLYVTVGWHTEGRGDKDSDSLMDLTLHEGTIVADEHKFPFSCELPVGPVSYAGHDINIIWEVHAQLDLAWKRDPKTTRQFFLTIP
jgi:hypothetical protein